MEILSTAYIGARGREAISAAYRGNGPSGGPYPRVGAWIAGGAKQGA